MHRVNSAIVAADISGVMLWLCRRQDQVLHLETRLDEASHYYTVTWQYPNGNRRTDSFVTLDGLHEYLDTLTDELVEDGWDLTPSVPIRTVLVS